MGKIIMNGNAYGSVGSDVEANPQGTATDTLNTIGIDNVIYEIQGGGGGSSYNGALDWSGMITVTTSLDASGIDFAPDKDGVIIASGYSEDAFVPICIQITGVSKEIYLTVSQNSYTSEYFPLNKGIQIHIYRGTSSISLTDIDIYFVPFKIGYNSGDTMCEVLFDTPASTDAWVNPVVVSCIPLNYDLITFEILDPDGIDNLLMFTPQSVSLDTAAGDYTKGYKLQSGANTYLSRIENAVRMFTSTGTTLTLNKVVGYRFGKGEYYSPIIYSTEEREIGVWVDNKPLYQKTFVSNITLQSNSWTQTNLNIQNLDSIIKSEVARNNLSDTSDNGHIIAGIDIDHTNGRIDLFNFRNVEITITSITIWYTKTTDTPGSGQYNTLGVPTVHYSTDEQVIGTDYDGKPIYQKTYTNLGTINSSTNIDLQLSNISWITVDSANSNLSNCIPFPYVHPNTYNAVGYFFDMNGGSPIINCRAGSDASGSFTLDKLTVRYKKTTD